MRSLEDFETEADHAAWFDVDPRTIRRWRNQPDGVPYTKAGATVLYKRAWTIEWLESRRRQSNPAPQQQRGRRRGRRRRTERQLKEASAQ